MLLNKKIPVGFLLGKVKYELFILILYVLVIEILDEFFKIKGLFIPVAIPAILGTTISLILGFRLNQSYDRWWEARKIWGAIVNDSRTLLRQNLAFMKNAPNPAEVRHLQEEIKVLQQAWCYALARTLRNQPQEEIHRLLPPDTLARISSFDNIPNQLLKLHSELLMKARHESWINDFQFMLIDQTHTRLCDAMGKAERIKNTVFPMTYSLVVEFLLYLFVVLLPFGLIEYLGYMEAPLILLFCIPFFMLEKSAIHLQDPFSGYPTDVPVLTISATIENNLNKMMDEDSVTQPMPQPHKYYVM